jgi:glutaminase
MAKHILEKHILEKHILEKHLKKIYDTLKNGKGGKNADYIPELKKVNPNLYAISIVTVDGEDYSVGDYKKEFAIESCSKVFTLALALEKVGIKVLKEKIGTDKSLDTFNSINAVENNLSHTINSFNNGGAMATTSLLYEKNKNKNKTLNKIVDNMSEFAGRKLHVDKKIYTSEINNASHNLAIAYLLNSYNRFYGDVQECVDIYTRQCSVMVTSRDVAIMAATMANKGVNPKTHKKIIEQKYISYILNHMKDNGLYEESGDWMKTVGLPVKSGVSGIVMIVIPGVMGIGIISPPLNKYGNSVKGIKTAKLLLKSLAKG